MSAINDIPGDKRGVKYIGLGISPDYRICLLSRGRHNDYYRILIDFGGTERLLNIYEENCSFHGVDLLPNERILLYGYGRGKQTQESITYGCIYDMEGHLERRIAFGTGIGRVQSNDLGEIWVSYFEEGLLSDDELAKTGLNCWNTNGELTYQFTGASELSPMEDCYIMNVANNRSVWFYYKPDYKLILLLNQKELAVYDPGIQKAQVLAVWRNRVIMDMGDGSMQFVLLELQKNGSTKLIDEFCFLNEDKQKIYYDRCFYRGKMLIIEKNKKIYKVDLQEILAGKFVLLKAIAF